MNGNQKFEMQCTDFDALLTDALDGLLQGERLAGFERHRAQCPACSLAFQEARSGMDWLHALDEVEPPRNLLHNVIAATSGAALSNSTAILPRKSWFAQFKDRWLPKFAGVMTPRFAMSFGMAFFSASMLMSVAGVRPMDLRHLDLTPKGIRKTYYETEARATRYYENMRLVYELQALGHQLKKAAETPEPKPEESKPDRQGNDPARREQNYSRHDQDQILAGLTHYRIILRG